MQVAYTRECQVTLHCWSYFVTHCRLNLFRQLADETVLVSRSVLLPRPLSVSKDIEHECGRHCLVRESNNRQISIRFVVPVGQWQYAVSQVPVWM